MLFFIIYLTITGPTYLYINLYLPVILYLLVSVFHFINFIKCSVGTTYESRRHFVAPQIPLQWYTARYMLRHVANCYEAKTSFDIYYRQNVNLSLFLFVGNCEFYIKGLPTVHLAGQVWVGRFHTILKR